MSAWEHKLKIEAMQFWKFGAVEPYWAWYVTCSCDSEFPNTIGSFVHRGADGYYGRETWLEAFTLGMAHQIEQIVKEVNG